MQEHISFPDRQAVVHRLAKPLHISFRVLLVSALLSNTGVHAATVVVPPGTGFFDGWTFNTNSSTPSNCAVVPPSDPLVTFTGALGSNTYVMSSAPSPLPNVWLNCAPWSTFGNGVPAGTGAPATVNTLHIKRGVTTFRFAAPLPVNTVYFSQDVDAGEVVNISFADCSGNPVDASGFDHLQVSVPRVPTNTLPTVTPGAASWTVASTGSSPNETVGIVIKSANVCEIHNVNTAPGTGGGGGNHFFFGTPPVPVVPVSPTAVPAMSPGMLGGMAAMLAFAAAGLGVRRRKP